MTNDILYLPHRRTIPPPSRSVFLLFLILSSIPLAHSQCSRRSRNTATTPEFLCQLNATFVRESDCFARVTETIIFPHTTGRSEERIIQALPNIQQVSEILLQRNDEELKVHPKLDSDGTVIVPLATQQTTDPTTFVLSYRISNAAMRFTDGCGRGDPNPQNNVLRYRTGPLDKTVDLLSVVFSTVDDRTLAVVGGDGTTSSKISITESNFEEAPDFSVEENGGRVCPVDQVCFMTSMPIWQIAIIIAMIAVPLLLTATCIVVFTICEVCGVRSEVAGDDPIDESEMVGFTSGRYSGCIPNDDGFGGCECKKEQELFDIE